MNTLHLIALLFTLSAFLCIVNARVLHLPMTIGVMILSMLCSLLIVVLNPLFPHHDLKHFPQTVLGAVNLPQALLNGALSLLLFAGTLGVDFGHFRTRLASVSALALLGTVLAVILLAGATWVIFPLLGIPIPFLWCVLLGAILAPTDPVSVVGMLRRLGLPGALQAVFAGESLLNDGVGIVVFDVTIGLATGHVEGVTLAEIAIRFVREAIGGCLLGFATGWLALLVLRLVRDTRDPHITLLVSLALATGTFSLASLFGMSGAVAVVVAGLCLGTQYGRFVLDADARKKLDGAWSLFDEVLNALLFVLIGFEMLEVPEHLSSFTAMLVVIPLAVIVRWLSVFLSTLPVHLRHWDKGRMVAMLTWGGLRGGISVSLALSLPAGDLRNLLLPICYGVVVFTIIVQGLTMEHVATRLYPKEK
ncbi:cation:proton antiporter [Acetobacter conturbans]|uniref:Sodium:proton antiporter n=1 Tax=Acetobacter conturbans TaxID=1737472 RepID=A0ABX0K2V7_9PROT|nr:sodium:proton antiporter [Acetobacter conturbans]NHN88342.1 sodium:proton antiporter [Acetobacter conturbans]